jgi:hypothetical protein
MLTTIWPIVPALDDDDDDNDEECEAIGGMIGRMKLKYLEKTCPSTVTVGTATNCPNLACYFCNLFKLPRCFKYIVSAMK